MKLPLSILVGAFFLASAAFAADTVPTTEVEKEVAPAASQIPATADCAAVNLSTPSWLGDPEVCGPCSLDGCGGDPVGQQCSPAGAPLRTCQPLGLCVADSSPLCRCRLVLSAP